MPEEDGSPDNADTLDSQWRVREDEPRTAGRDAAPRGGAPVRAPARREQGWGSRKEGRGPQGRGDRGRDSNSSFSGRGGGQAREGWDRRVRDDGEQEDRGYGGRSDRGDREEGGRGYERQQQDSSEKRSGWGGEQQQREEPPKSPREFQQASDPWQQSGAERGPGSFNSEGRAASSNAGHGPSSASGAGREAKNGAGRGGSNSTAPRWTGTAWERPQAAQPPPVREPEGEAPPRAVQGDWQERLPSGHGAQQQANQPQEQAAAPAGQQGAQEGSWQQGWPARSEGRGGRSSQGATQESEELPERGQGMRGAAARALASGRAEGPISSPPSREQRAGLDSEAGGNRDRGAGNRDRGAGDRDRGARGWQGEQSQGNRGPGLRPEGQSQGYKGSWVRPEAAAAGTQSADPTPGESMMRPARMPRVAPTASLPIVRAGNDDKGTFFSKGDRWAAHKMELKLIQSVSLSLSLSEILGQQSHYQRQGMLAGQCACMLSATAFGAAEPQSCAVTCCAMLCCASHPNQPASFLSLSRLLTLNNKEP